MKHLLRIALILIVLLTLLVRNLPAQNYQIRATTCTDGGL